MVFSKAFWLKLAIFVSYTFVSTLVLSGLLTFLGKSFTQSVIMFGVVIVAILIGMLVRHNIIMLELFVKRDFKESAPEVDNINDFLFSVFLRIINIMAYSLFCMILIGQVFLLWTKDVI